MREQTRRGTSVLRIEVRRRLHGQVREAFVAEVSLARGPHLAEPRIRKLLARVATRLRELTLPPENIETLVASVRPRLEAGGWVLRSEEDPVGRVAHLRMLAGRVIARTRKHGETTEAQ